MRCTRKRCLGAVAGLTAAALGMTMGVVGVAHGQPDVESWHPKVLWADSEELAGEAAPNGTIAALVDDDSDHSDDQVTFWTTKWKNGSDPFPHALVLENTSDQAVCGIRYTARPSYGAVQGATNAPGRYAVYSFNDAPAKAADMTAQRQEWRQGHFGTGEQIATGGLQAVNAPQDISFTRTTAKYLSVVGLQAVSAQKSQMSASDIKLLGCPADPIVAPSNPAQGSGSDDLVNDFFVDQLPFTGSAGEAVWFTPGQHTYASTAYAHAATVSVRVRAVSGAEVTVNGEQVDSRGRATIALHDGVNAVTVRAEKAGSVATYAVNITKVSTEYRGNVSVPSKVTINGASAADDSAMTDGNLHTSWTSGAIQRSNAWSDSVTGFTVHLDSPRWVKRVNLWGMPTMPSGAPWWHGGNSVSIAVQDSDTGLWTTVVERASLRRDAQGLFYWDLNSYRRAKNIRVWLNDRTSNEVPAANRATAVRFDEVEVWGLPAGHTPAANPKHTATPAFDANAAAKEWGVNRAQALAIHNGIILPAWVPSEGYGRGVMNAREQQLSGGAIPMFYDSPLFNSQMMERLPNSQWGLAKAPAGGNSMGSWSSPKDFLTEEMKPYANNLVDIQYGDEGGYSDSEVQRFKQWFDFSRTQYPQAITHSNQYNDQSWASHMNSYVRTAQPDLLSWDTYYFGGGGVFGSHGPRTPDQVLPNLLGTRMWQAQREAALKGLTGDGSSPILFGQYLDYSFDINASESQKAIVPMLSLASGMKWFGLFRMEYNGYDYGSIIDHDGAPTRAFFEYARIFDDVKGYGKYLVGLDNSYLALRSGDYGNRSSALPSGWEMGSFDSAEARGHAAAVGLVDMSVKNLGNLNEGRPGDVAVGYFNKVPGLSDAMTQQIFGQGTTDPRAMMVVNGLVGSTTLPSTGLMTRTDEGAYWQTSQQITLTLTKPSADARLMMVEPGSGKAVPASVVPSGTDGGVTLTMTLGGGQGRLLYWATPTSPEPNPSVSPSAPTPPPTSTTPAPTSTTPTSTSTTPAPTTPAPSTSTPAPGTTEPSASTPATSGSAAATTGTGRHQRPAGLPRTGV